MTRILNPFTIQFLISWSCLIILGWGCKKEQKCPVLEKYELIRIQEKIKQDEEYGVAIDAEAESILKGLVDVSVKGEAWYKSWDFVSKYNVKEKHLDQEFVQNYEVVHDCYCVTYPEMIDAYLDDKKGLYEEAKRRWDECRVKHLDSDSLSKNEKISGQVTDKNGRPLGGAKVILSSLRSHTSPTVTESDGSFTFNVSSLDSSRILIFESRLTGYETSFDTSYIDKNGRINKGPFRLAKIYRPGPCANVGTTQGVITLGGQGIANAQIVYQEQVQVIGLSKKQGSFSFNHCQKGIKKGCGDIVEVTITVDGIGERRFPIKLCDRQHELEICRFKDTKGTATISGVPLSNYTLKHGDLVLGETDDFGQFSFNHCQAGVKMPCKRLMIDFINGESRETFPVNLCKGGQNLSNL